MFLDSRQKLRRQQAAAIKQLDPCTHPKSDAAALKGLQSGRTWLGKGQAGPTWDFQVLQLSSRKGARDTSHSQGKVGQTVLSVPQFMGADISISLPPALNVAATHSGSVDCRLQLLGLTAEWPAEQQPRQQPPQLLHARSSAAGFAVRCGGLLLAQALFPEHTNQVLGCLAVPVAVADGIAAVSATVPAGAKQAVAHRASRAKHMLQGTGRRRPRKGCNGFEGCTDDGVARIGWVDVSAGLLFGAMHTVRRLTGPAAAIAAGGWLLSVLHPSSHTLCSCLVALMAVSADYQQLGAEAARGKHGTGKSVEWLWHARHKAAAQRLAPFLGDLPPTPPLQPIISLARCCSIAVGIAVDGQHLSGALADSNGHPCISTFAQQQQQQQQRLLVCGSYQAQAARNSSSKTHEAAGLRRAQLLELFTGTAESADCGSPAACAATAVAGGCEPLAIQQEGLTAVDVTVASHFDDVDDALVIDTVPDSSGLSTPQPEVRGANLTVVPTAHPTSAGVNGARSNTAGNTGSSGRSTIMKASSSDPSGGTGGAGGNITTSTSNSNSSSSRAIAADPLAFLDGLPLYGQQDHAGTAAAAAAAANVGVRHRALLYLRGVYLLLVFSPFFLLGVPMLLLAWYLTARAQQHQQKGVIIQQQQRQGCPSSSLSRGGVGESASSSKTTKQLLSRTNNTAVAVWQQLKQPAVLLRYLLRQLSTLLTRLAAVLHLLVVMLVGGGWFSGGDAWLSTGLWLRQRAWQLLLLSCRSAGAAFIKWGQWSSSRRDMFPEDFCDTLAQLHDRAPVHSFKHTQREVESSFGIPINQLFDTFHTEPLASGSIAQVHRATVRNSRVRAALEAATQGNSTHQLTRSSRNTSTNHLAHASSVMNDSSPNEAVLDVIVKVCHPNVAYHIAQDFRLLSALSAAAVRLPALRGLSSSIRESVSQFSHTMTAQTDLRVEAVHALRFHSNFKGVKSSVRIPRPIPRLISSTVLVETYEPGRSVATYMKEASAMNTQIVGLGVDAFMKMLLVDNFVHTDLHPGNILFRAVPVQRPARQQQQQHVQQPSSKEGSLQQQQQQEQHPTQWWNRLWRRNRSISSSGGSVGPAAMTETAGGAAAGDPGFSNAATADEQWSNKHGIDSSSSSNVTAQVSCGSEDQQLHHLSGSHQHGSSSNSSQRQCDSSTSNAQSAAVSAQLVLLDFGLAEQLTPEVRHHFISFLMAISAGDGLAAARHLLQWSHNQTCPDTSAFTADIVDLFREECDIQRDEGIDLDAVMKSVLGLARKHHVGIDSCYASLVISVCVLVGFAKALDPGVNLMDAATPTLLAYAMTGAVVGRLYST